jgi:hypothetical protein
MRKFLSIFFALIFSFSIILFSNSGQARNKVQEDTDAQICRAAISTIMGKDLTDVRFDKKVKKVKYISFDPKEKKSTFKFKCHVDGNRIHWASEFGNWKDSDLDSVVTYKIKEKFFIVSESYNSGYNFHKRFNLKDVMGKNK